MAAVKFSIVIPTRERAATLRHALRTCLDQSFEDYEIVVSDNDSSPATKSVVEEIGSTRVRYVRTPRLLAMSSNWDFAVSHARGEYVILIGDDDGLLPHALVELDALTRERGTKVIRWEAAFYTWPSIALPGHGDYLRLPMGRGVRELVGLDVIRAAIAFQLPYSALPMLYNAAVHRSVLDKLRSITGRVFPHPVPDVYSGFAIAAVAERFTSTDIPMTISGQSGASNGIAVLFNRGTTPIDREFRELNANEGFVPDPRIPDLPVFPHVPVADAFAFAKQKLFPSADVDFDRRRFITGCVENLQVRNEADWRAALRLLNDSLADVPELQQWFDAEYADKPFTGPPPSRLRAEKMGYDGEFLHLNAAEFGVTDVAGAANLCDQILNYRANGVTYRGFLVQELRRLNAERQQMIEHLHRECEIRLAKIRELDARLVRALRGGPLKRIARWIKKQVEAKRRIGGMTPR